MEHRVTVPGGNEEWFAVIPDDPAAGRMAMALGEAPQRVKHGSGRPWLVGRWEPAHLHLASVGEVTVAVLGTIDFDTVSWPLR